MTEQYATAYPEGLDYHELDVTDAELDEALAEVIPLTTEVVTDVTVNPSKRPNRVQPTIISSPERMAERAKTVDFTQQNVEPEAAEEDEEIDALDEEAPITDSVRVYLKEIGKVALLNAEQEVELARSIETGLFASEKLRQADNGEIKLSRKMPKADLEQLVIDGQQARDHLLEANLRLVVSLAKRYQNKGLTLLDLIQEGNAGLIRGVDKFDYTKGFKFSTYATWWIRQAIQRALADQGRTIRIPVHMTENISKALRIKRDFATEHGRYPNFEEIAAIEGKWTPEKAEEILGYDQLIISLDTPVGDDEKDSLSNFIEDYDAPIAAEVLDFGLLQTKLKSVLDSLPERSAVVIRMRFGLEDGRARTLDEVGKELGLTRERIRQIERDTLYNLRRPSSPAQTLKAWL